VYDKSLVLHNHHIIPVNMGGGNEKTNFVKLSVEDHINAHIMLAKCWPDDTKGNIDNYRSSRMLGKFSITDTETNDAISSSYRGKNNPFYGKKHSTESRVLMSKNCSGRRSKNKSYEAIYGDTSELERLKRSDGVKSSWENMTEEELAERSHNISLGLRAHINSPDYKNGFSISIIVEGIEYNSYAAAARFYGISGYKLKKLYEIIEK